MLFNSNSLQKFPSEETQPGFTGATLNSTRHVSSTDGLKIAADGGAEETATLVHGMPFSSACVATGEGQKQLGLAEGQLQRRQKLHG